MNRASHSTVGTKSTASILLRNLSIEVWRQEENTATTGGGKYIVEYTSQQHYTGTCCGLAKTIGALSLMTMVDQQWTPVALFQKKGFAWDIHISAGLDPCLMVAFASILLTEVKTRSKKHRKKKGFVLFSITPQTLTLTR
jgi:hypothetical protein